MANNEDVNAANQGAPAADIPDLKKKEKERKKAGAGWAGAKPGAGSFSGATGGTVARAAASAATGGTAVAASAVAGKSLIAAGVAAVLAGAGLYGYATLKGGGASGPAKDLGAISSSMKVRAGGGDRTGVVSNGEIVFDPVKNEPKKPEKAPEDKTAAAAAPEAEQAAQAGQGADWNRPTLEHNMSGSKLSSSLGGDFGGKNIFSGNGAAPKLNEGLSKINLPQRGKLSAAKTTKAGGRITSGAKGHTMKSNRAFGQALVAKGISTFAIGAGSGEGARSTASNAFDGPTPGNGNVEGGPRLDHGGGVANTPGGGGGGAPDVTAPNVTVPGGVDMQQNLGAMMAMAAMAQMAGEMKAKAEKLMKWGIGLIIAGHVIPFCGFLIPIGIMLVGLSIMMDQMADMMMEMANSMSASMASSTGDHNQDEINRYCIRQAYENHTNPRDCRPPSDITHEDEFDRVDREEMNEHVRRSHENQHTQER